MRFLSLFQVKISSVVSQSYVHGGGGGEEGLAALCVFE